MEEQSHIDDNKNHYYRLSLIFPLLFTGIVARISFIIIHLNCANKKYHVTQHRSKDLMRNKLQKDTPTLMNINQKSCISSNDKEFNININFKKYNHMSLNKKK